VEYSRKKGECKYLVKPGTIVRLDKECVRLNPKIGTNKGVKVPHAVFIWVIRVAGAQPKRHRSPKLQMLRVVYFYWPTASDMKDHYLLYERDVQQETIVKQMRDNGFKLVDTQCNYHNNEASWKAFYKKIGYFSQ